MNTKLAVAGVALVVAVGGAAAFVVGVGPFTGSGGDPAGTPEGAPESTGTVYEVGDGGGSGGGDGSSGDDGGGDGGSGSGDATATATPPPPPFAFTIDNIEQCGQTCREVTATISNQQATSASDVAVYTRIYAGNSTAEGDKVWEGLNEVGTLEGGGAATRTDTVELSLVEAGQVQNNDGWITIVTTVESAERTITFRNNRNVL